MPEIIYSRPVFYYETDRMDCVHHSNYIRWFEEARIHFMSQAGFSYEGLEAAGILSPVLSVQAEYRSMCRFGDRVNIAVSLASYTGVRVQFFYTVTDASTGALRCQGSTAHCFIGAAGRPLSLKKALPLYHQKIEAYIKAGE